MIRLLDLPLVPEIENRVTLHEMVPARETDHHLEQMIDTLIRETLGVPYPSYMYTDIIYGSPDDDDVEDDSDDDDITSWRKDGFDVRGEDGKELRCLTRIDWALEVVIAGRADRSRLDIEASIWKRSKALDDAVNQNHKAKDQAFLQLGARRRRGT